MALTEIPSELSSTPSIVDNGNATAITIGSDESVALGGALTANGGIDVTGLATASEMTVSDTDDIRLRFLNGTTFKAGLQVATSTGDMISGSAVDDLAIRSQANMLFSAGGNTEAMRISGGNLLVGKTALEYENTAGHIFRNDGLQSSIRSGGNVADFNRLSSSGEIIRFSKDGETVGNISVISGDRMLFATADGLGLTLDKDNNRIVPSDATGGANSNVSLGSSGLEFKDIYLSGGAYLGGTAAANKLDSYEEGTWTPTTTGLTGLTIHTARYVKVGSLVSIDLRIAWTGSDQASGLLAFGLPFASSNPGTTSRTGVVFYSGTSLYSGAALSSHVSSGDNGVGFYATSGGGFAPVARHHVNGAYHWLVSFNYFTDL